MSGAIGRLLMLTGVLIFAVGVLIHFAPQIPLLGKLPGDFRIDRGGFRTYLPLGSSLLISLVLTLILQLVSRLR